MNISMKTLWQMVNNPKPDGADLAILQRHFCSQLYLNNLCTTHCMDDCCPHVEKLFDLARGEFILKPKAMLVGCCRQVVSDIIHEARSDHKAETPKNDLGEPTPEADVFASLTKHYESTTTLG